MASKLKKLTMFPGGALGRKAMLLVAWLLACMCFKTPRVFVSRPTVPKPSIATRKGSLAEPSGMVGRPKERIGSFQLAGMMKNWICDLDCLQVGEMMVEESLAKEVIVFWRKFCVLMKTL